MALEWLKRTPAGQEESVARGLPLFDPLPERRHAEPDRAQERRTVRGKDIASSAAILTQRGDGNMGLSENDDVFEETRDDTSRSSVRVYENGARSLCA